MPPACGHLHWRDRLAPDAAFGHGARELAPHQDGIPRAACKASGFAIILQYLNIYIIGIVNDEMDDKEYIMIIIITIVIIMVMIWKCDNLRLKKYINTCHTAGWSHLRQRWKTAGRRGDESTPGTGRGCSEEARQEAVHSSAGGKGKGVNTGRCICEVEWILIEIKQRESLK